MDDVVAMLPSLLQRLSDRVLLPAEVTCKVVTEKPKDGAKLCSGLEREYYDEKDRDFCALSRALCCGRRRCGRTKMGVGWLVAVRLKY